MDTVRALLSDRSIAAQAAAQVRREMVSCALKKNMHKTPHCKKDTSFGRSLSQERMPAR
jgi:hypothetical protein